MRVLLDMLTATSGLPVGLGTILPFLNLAACATLNLIRVGMKSGSHSQLRYIRLVQRGPMST